MTDLWPVVVRSASQAFVIELDPTQFTTLGNLNSTGRIQAITIAAQGDVWANAYHGPPGRGAWLVDNAGTPISFWNDPNGGFHVQYANGVDICSWRWGTGKTFVIDHPTDDTRYLVHACLEGPEAGVYYRGEARCDDDCRAEVTLPDYFTALVQPGSVSVQVTAVLENEDSGFGAVAATRVKDGAFIIRSELAGQAVAWRVEAKRVDIEVEPLRKNTLVDGFGPYRYVHESSPPHP